VISSYDLGIELSSTEPTGRRVGREQRGVGIVLKLSDWTGIDALWAVEREMGGKLSDGMGNR
jgi:hypothetical protein